MVTESRSISFNEQRDIYFPRLWNANERVVNVAIRKYSFITADEADDYRQEIFIFVWQRYEKWIDASRKGVAFDAWLYTQAKTAIFRYRERLVGRGARRDKAAMQRGRYRFYENFTYFPIADNLSDSVYCEENYQGLSRAISDLSEKDQGVVNLFLEGANFSALSTSEGKSPSAFSQRFRAIVERIRKHCDNYFPYGSLRLPARKIGKRNEECSNSNPIQQFDLNGNLVTTWPSAKEAERTGGFDSGQISQVANGKRYQCAGFRWIKVGETRSEILNMKPNDKKKPLLQIDGCGRVVKEWESINEAARAGFMPAGIYSSIRRDGKLYRDCTWRYSQ